MARGKTKRPTLRAAKAKTNKTKQQDKNEEETGQNRKAD